MTFVATFIALAILGMANAGYLAYAHRRRVPLICPLDHDCGAVTESGWARVAGIRNELLGVFFYAAALGFALTPLFLPDNAVSIKIASIFFTGAGLIFSVFLTFLQAFVIKQYCFYCLISALITMLLFINSFAL